MSNKTYTEALINIQNNNWDAAHRIVQEIDSPEAAWIHAHIHRIEGDLGNAAYWYRIAGRPECRTSLDQEWQELFDALG